MTIHINYTKTHAKGIDRRKCPDCGKLSYFVWFHQEWYGVDTTCMRCGRSWSDGEWMPFEFYRHARRDSKRAARRRWKRGKA